MPKLVVRLRARGSDRYNPGIGALTIRTLPLWLVGAYLAVAPNFDVVGFAASYDELRLLQLVVLAAVTVWLVVSPSARRNWLDTFVRLPLWSRGLLAVVAAGGVASAARATDPTLGLLEVAHLILLGCLAVAVADVFRREGRRADRLALASISVAAGLFLLDFAVRYAAAMSTGAGSPPLPYEAFPAFSNPRFFGQWQTWTLPVLVAGCLLAPAAAWPLRALTFVVAAGWWALLLVSGTRGTMVAQAFALLFVAVAFRGNARPWLRLQIAAVATGGAIYAVTYLAAVDSWAAFLAMFDHVASFTGSGRRELWAAALELIKENPLLGVGPQNYAYHTAVREAHPHNVLLQWASEWGAGSAVVVTITAAAGLAAWLRRALTLAERPDDRAEGALACALSAALAAGGAHAMLSGIIVMPLSQTLAALIVGWALGVHLRAASEPASDPASLPTHRLAPALPAVLVCTLAVMLVCAWPSAGKAFFEHHVSADGSDERFSPRFWRRTVRTPLPDEHR